MYIVHWIPYHSHRCECQEASEEWIGPRTCPDFCPKVAGHCWMAADQEDFRIMNQTKKAIFEATISEPKTLEEVFFKKSYLMYTYMHTHTFIH